jgi:hypothetical protein
MKVQVLLPIWPLAVGDVVDIPEEVAALWCSTRIAQLAGNRQQETAFLPPEQKMQLLQGLAWTGEPSSAW